MKKRVLTKVMTLAMVCAMAMGNMAMTVHAAEDGTDHHDSSMESGDDSSAAITIGGGGNSDSGSSSNSGGGSSYDDGANRHDASMESGDNSSEAISLGGGSTASAPAPKAAGTTASVTGKETFRAVAKAGAGTYKVIHKGVDIATFTLMDADKKAVPCTAVNLKQREDGKWAINYQVTVQNAETTGAADTTGLTVGAPLDRTYLYNTLGISYISINDTVIIDIAAEAAAK